MSYISKQLSSITVSTIKGREEPAPFGEVRLVLLGKTGNGKSSTANSILGCMTFESKVSCSSVTQRYHTVSGDCCGRHISLVDTPGLLDTQQTPEEVQRELGRCVTLLSPGPHAFLLVLRIGRFTQGEREAVGQIQRSLGPRALGFSVVVFTHGDCVEEGRSVRDYLTQGSEGLAELVARCGGRYCVFNNRASRTKEQVSELLALVDSTVKANGGGCYTSKMLKEAEEELARELQEQRRLVREKEELVRRQQEESLKEWYQRELEKIQLRSERQMEELRRNRELQRVKEEELAREREETVRRENEENDKKEEVRMKEEEEKKEALHAQLKTVTKTLEELRERGERMKRELEERMKREMEEAIQRDRVENKRKERERQLQQLEKEQTIKQRGEMRRDTLQKELNRFTRKMEEQRKREEQRDREREELIRNERRENQREREREMENQRAERKRSTALQRQMWCITMEMKEQKEKEERMKRELDEILQREKERSEAEIRKLKGECERDCLELCREAVLVYKRSAEEPNTLTALIRPVTGYAQEMALVVMNVALQSIGAPCCIQ